MLQNSFLQHLFLLFHKEKKKPGIERKGANKISPPKLNSKTHCNFPFMKHRLFLFSIYFL